MELIAAVAGLLSLCLLLAGGVFVLSLGVKIRRSQGAWSVESRALTTIGFLFTLLGILAILMAYGVSQT